jgi:hypothetical protein
MKKFDLQKALSGAKLVTRDGREVKGFGFREGTHGDYPCTALVDGLPETYTMNGEHSLHYDGPLDLFLADDDTKSLDENKSKSLEDRVAELESIINKLKDETDKESGDISISTLKEYGFEKEWLSDLSGYWWQVGVKHPYLKGLYVTVSDGEIDVYCDDTMDGTTCFIYKTKATEDNIKWVMEWLDVT